MSVVERSDSQEFFCSCGRVPRLGRRPRPLHQVSCAAVEQQEQMGALLVCILYSRALRRLAAVVGAVQGSLQCVCSLPRASLPIWRPCKDAIAEMAESSKTLPCLVHSVLICHADSLAPLQGCHCGDRGEQQPDVFVHPRPAGGPRGGRWEPGGGAAAHG